jgi:hypothetical protein
MTRVSAGLRRLVIERANNCCEYCLISQEDRFLPYHVDHITAEKHDGDTTEDNLCWSCYICNSYKGDNIAGADPLTGKATFLFHPRRHQWSDHFRLDMASIEPLTPEGRVTVFLLRLNNAEHIAERNALIALDRFPCK